MSVSHFCRKSVFGFSLFFLFALIATSSAQAATFIVTKTADTNDNVCDSDCSLREAIAAANAAASDDVIEFDNAVFNTAKVIVTGNLQINGNGGLIINGKGANLLTLDGNNAYRLLTIGNSGNVTINGITITKGGGKGEFIITGGGGIYNLNGTLIINNSVISNNGAKEGIPASAGGGIYNGGTLILNNSTVTGNSSYAKGTGDSGGGIYNKSGSSLSVNNSTISNNTAEVAAGGGILNESGVTTVITNSTISNNKSCGGGGIYHTSGMLTVTNSTFANNTSIVGCGGSSGGGIRNETGTMNISGSTFKDNSAGVGGGIYNKSAGNVTESLFNGNSALDGNGGAIANESTLTIINSTFSGNNASTTYNFSGGNGGGISNGGTLNMSNSTVSYNSSLKGGAVSNFAIFTARNTIFAHNFTTSGIGWDFQGTLTSQGYNLIENTTGFTITGTTTGNVLGQDPQLLPLGNYGGPTQTVALQPNSPAIDAGDPNNFPATDQRGVSRPKDGDLNRTALPDIGAYERQPTVFTVTKTFDSNDGICDADCSLREALTATNAATTPDNAIAFASAVFGAAERTLSLTNGQLSVIKNGTLVINGTGANLLTINATNQSRILFVDTGAVAAINGLTVTGGNAANGQGGAVLNGGTLVLTNVRVIGNAAASGGGIYNTTGNNLSISNSAVESNTSTNFGGQVFNDGNLNVTNSTINGNSTKFSGGGINNSRGAATTINNSIVNGNTAGIAGGGGGIVNDLGTVNISNSTFVGNLADSGGGAYNSGSQSVMIIANSTINGNTARNSGGGIGNISAGAVLTITNTTVSGNSANYGGGIDNDYGAVLNLNSLTVNNNKSTNYGGGISNGGGGSTTNARNCIIADNTATRLYPDFSGNFSSLGYNLIENIQGITITGVTTGNILGQDPQLKPLGNYGGATQTVALQPTSPAIDSASPSNFPTTDQRGFARPRDGDGNGSARADIGAFELRTILVTNSNDSGAGSLRQSITDSLTSGDAVVFNAVRFSTPQTIVLTGGELLIPRGVNFTAVGGSATKLTISGNNQSRVLNINADANVSLNNVVITSGIAVTDALNGNGGCIYNAGTLALTNSTINNCSSAGQGGGIYNYSEGSLSFFGTTINNNSAVNEGGGIFNFSNNLLTISSSTVSNNTSTSYGGGLYNLGKVDVFNSTVNGNRSSGIGGGISNYGDMFTLINSTVSGNSAQTLGGGIYNSSGAYFDIIDSTITRNSANIGGGINHQVGGNHLTAHNTIIAGNSATGAAPDFDGVLTSQGYNLIQNTDRTTITGTTTGNLLNVDPLLDLVLRNNGGVTSTHALRASSPAIDAGSAVAGIATDQRGFSRPFDFPSIPNAVGGNGSDIGAVERQSTDFVPTNFDFDGDGKADISVYRPSEGAWYEQRSRSGFYGERFGASTDRPVPADYDGDGKTDIAVYRDGAWYLQRSRDGFYGINFGTAEDSPQPFDYDGDGKADIAVYRPSLGSWYIYNISTGQFTGYKFGAAEDKPVAADYDGDGKADIAVFRPSEAAWYIQKSRDGFFGMYWGTGTDKPTPADYDGDGKADIAVYRPENGSWYLNTSRDGFKGYQYGATEDLPVPADYDGDGKADIGIYRPSEGAWYIQTTRDGFKGMLFGTGTDKPIPNSFIP